MKRIHRLTLLLVIGFAIGTAGCTTQELVNFKNMPNPLSSKKAPEKISHIVCFWQPAEGRSTKGMPTRGVAGQILFFTYGKKEPIKISDDTDVFVYLFDNQGTAEERKKPMHRFSFIDQSWNAHLKNGQMGASYHVFIPYERDVVHQVKCTLNVRAVTKKEPIISSDMTTVTLHGPLKKKDKIEITQNVLNNPLDKKTNISTFNPQGKTANQKLIANQKPKTNKKSKSVQSAFDRLANKIQTAPPSPAPQQQRREQPLIQQLSAQQFADQQLSDQQPEETNRFSHDPRDAEIQRLRQQLSQQQNNKRPFQQHPFQQRSLQQRSSQDFVPNTAAFSNPPPTDQTPPATNTGKRFQLKPFHPHR